MRKVLWIVGVISAGGALAMWAEVLGLGGNPDGGGPEVAVAAVLATLLAVGAFMAEARVSSK